MSGGSKVNTDIASEPTAVLLIVRETPDEIMDLIAKTYDAPQA